MTSPQEENLDKQSIIERLKQYLRPNYLLFLITFAAIAVGVFARFFRLWIPEKLLFDESHYVSTAKLFLEGNNHFHDHPALGKFLIAIGIEILGDNSLGWRIMPAFLGVGLIAIFGLLAYRLFRSSSAATLAVICISLDGAFIFYSRTAHLDGIIPIFFLAAILFACYEDRLSVHMAILAAIFAGFSGATKMNGIAVIVPVSFALYLRKRPVLAILTPAIALLSYFGIAVLAEIVMRNPNPIDGALAFQKFSFDYHFSTLKGHYFSSYWWTWLLMLRPLNMPVDLASGGTVYQFVMCNPLAFWSAAAIGLLCLVHLLVIFLFPDTGISVRVNSAFLLPKKSLLILLVAYFSYMLPWIQIKRPAFFYHYIPAYGCLVLIMCGYFGELFRKRPYIAVAFAALIFACALYFLPIWIGIPISKEDYLSKMWLHCWSAPCKEYGIID